MALRVPEFPRVDRLAGRVGGKVGGLVLDAVTPDRFEGSPAGFSQLAGPAPQGPVGYLSSLARSFDPRSAEGMFNLGMALVPGGGRLPLRYQSEADLTDLLMRAGVRPSVWKTRPDPALEALAGRSPGQRSYRGRAYDPDSASLFERYLFKPGEAGAGIGPRMVGGVYQSGYSGEKYRVLDVRVGSGKAGSTWQIKVEPLDPHAPYNTGPRWHSTAWDPRDKIIVQPPRAEANELLRTILGTRFDPESHRPPPPLRRTLPG